MQLIRDPRSYALIIVIFSSFITPFLASSINVALPVIGSDLDISSSILGWIPTVYLMAVAVLLIPMGRLADIYGRVKVFQWGVIICTISSVFAGLSTSGWMLIIFRVIQGIGASMIFSNISAIIFSVFPPLERGYALGWSSTGAYLGLFLGPPFGGFLTQHLGWESIFYFNVPLGVFCSYATRMIKCEWREASGEKFDFRGAFLMAVSIILILVGFPSIPGLEGLVLFIIGLLSFYVFYRYELMQEDPIFDFRLFRDRTFAWNGFTIFISYIAAYPIVFLLSLYLQYFHHLSPGETGLLLAIQPLLIAVISPVAGRLSDKEDPYIVASAGISLIILAMAVFSLLGSVPLIVSGLVLIGLGFGFFAAPNSKIVMGAVEKKFRGVASATIGTFRVLGQLMGMALVLLLINIYIGGGAIQANKGPFQSLMVASFILFIFILLIGLFLTLTARGSS